VDLFQTALGPNEILCEVRVLAVAAGAYVKTRQKASGFAVAGAAVAVESSGSVRIGITGVAAVPYRATGVEEALAGQTLSSQTIPAASRRAAEQIDPLEDMHASAEYRAHLACVNTARALADAARI